MTLPIIESCDGCGACCTYMDVPPGYPALLSGRETYAHWNDEDGPRLQSSPEEAKDAIRAWMDAGWHQDDGPCCWLDPETKRCRWYEWRPSICRDFEMGGDDCRRIRKEVLA